MTSLAKGYNQTKVHHRFQYIWLDRANVLTSDLKKFQICPIWGHSVVHTVLLGLRIVRLFGHYIHRPRHGGADNHALRDIDDAREITAFEHILKKFGHPFLES